MKWFNRWVDVALLIVSLAIILTLAVESYNIKRELVGCKALEMYYE